MSIHHVLNLHHLTVLNMQQLNLLLGILQLPRQIGDYCNSDPDHTQALDDYFQLCSTYWRDVYLNDSSPSNSFRKIEVLERKRTILEAMKEFATAPEPLTVLDCGCGPGGILHGIMQLGHNAVGVDISSWHLSLSRDLIANAGNLIQGDGYTLPFEDNTFDAIVCAGVIQYLPSEKPLISELQRVAKPHGMIYLTIPNMHRIGLLTDPRYLVRCAQYLYQKFLRARKPASPLRAHDFSQNSTFTNKRYFYGQLNHLFRSFNLKIEKTYGVAYGPFSFFGKHMHSIPTSIRVNAFCEKLSRNEIFSLIRALANHWVVCLRKDGR